MGTTIWETRAMADKDKVFTSYRRESFGSVGVPGEVPQASPSSDKVPEFRGLEEQGRERVEHSLSVGAAVLNALAAYIMFGPFYGSDWLFALPFVSGPVALFLTMPNKDQASTRLDRSARLWLQAVFTLALGGFFFTGVSILVVVVVGMVLNFSESGSINVLFAALVQFVPAAYLRKKRSKKIAR